MELLSLSTTILKASTVVFIVFITYQTIFLLQLTNANPQTDLIPVNQTIRIPNINDLEFNAANKTMYVSSLDLEASPSRNCCIYIIGPANLIIDNITTRGYDLEFNPANNNMYAITTPKGTVSVINGKTNQVIDTVLGLADDPRFLKLKFNPANESMYVYGTDPISGVANLSVLDITTNKVKENISIGFGGEYLEFNPANNNFYMPISDSDSVLVIDGESNRIIDNITVGDGPLIPMFNPVNNNIYVTNTDSSTVSVIDMSNKVIDNIVIPDPVSLEFNPANNKTYVSSGRSDVISVLDSSNRLIQNVSLIGNDGVFDLGFFMTPQLGFNPANTNMYAGNPHQTCNTVTNSSGFSSTCTSTVAVIDSTNNTVIANVFTGAAGNFKFNPANNNMYATRGQFINVGGDDILVIAEK